MSRTGWSDTNFLRYAAAIVTADPCTLACWAYAPSLANQVVMGAFNSGSPQTNNSYKLEINSSGNVLAVTCNATTQNSALTSTALSINTWFHACAKFASSNSRTAFLNGGGAVQNTVNTTPTGINRFSIGTGDGSSQSGPFSSTGLIADAAVWNVALSATDIAALATGISPLLIRPDALVAYWPLIGNNSPENNLISNTSVESVQGTLSAGVHPRIFMPKRRLIT